MTTEKQWLMESGEDPSFLSQCLEAGFVLHELDELVILIHRQDVHKLSGYAQIGGSHGPISGEISQYVEERINKSHACYDLRAQGKKWEEVANLAKVNPSNAVTLAKNYAKANGKEWPIEL